VESTLVGLLWWSLFGGFLFGGVHFWWTYFSGVLLVGLFWWSSFGGVTLLELLLWSSFLFIEWVFDYVEFQWWSYLGRAI
jgi:hypothetical protein